MSESLEINAGVSGQTNQPDAETLVIQEIVDHASRKFGEEYSKNEKASTLIAQNELIHLVRSGKMSPTELRGILEEPSKFEAILVTSHAKFEARKDQEIQTRLANLDKNTHWKIAAGISLGTGMVTGLVFAFASPFITTWLQPTADELFKHPTSAQTVPVPQPQLVQNITTNNNVYNFFPAEARPTPPQLPTQPYIDEKKSAVKLTCNNLTLDAAKASLLNLFKGSNVVTLEMNGKKVSLCYRPQAKATGVFGRAASSSTPK